MASSMQQLNAELMNALRGAMSKANGRIFKETRKAVKWFYSGGVPVMYKRTGQLGNTPRTTAVSSAMSGVGGSVTFEIYLEQGGGYGTGDNPSMAQVLDLANYGSAWTTKSGRTARPTVGNQGFWEKAEDQMQKILDQEVGSVFH